MLLKDALDLLKVGKFVCRESWTMEDGYLSLMPGMLHIWKIVLHPAPNAGNYIFSYADLVGDDWKEFGLKKEVVEAEVAEAV
jgi:hypothetical protein